MNLDELIETLEQKVTELAGQEQSLNASQSTRSDLTTEQQIDHLKLNFDRLYENCPFVDGDLVTQNPYNTMYRYPQNDQPAIVAETYASTYFEAMDGHALAPYNMIIGMVTTAGNVFYYKVHASYFVPFNQEQ